MSPPKFSIVITFFAVLILPSDSASYIAHDCPNTTTYTANSTFGANLRILISSLSSNSTARNGFYNSTAGQTTSNVVYGLFLCRGDLSTAECRECVDTATTDVLRLCPNEMQTVIWYDECLLRYSNQYLFSAAVTSPLRILYNVFNITEPGRFRELLGNTMNQVIADAVNGGSAKKFGAKVENFTSFQNLYTLVQCTPDLSSSDCSNCLGEGASYIYKYAGNQGGRILSPSCNLRFEIYPFFNTTAASPPTTSPPPSITTVPTSKGKGKISTVTIVAIVVPIAFSLVLLALGYCFIIKRIRKKYDTIQEEASNEITTVESLQYDLGTIGLATNNFSVDHKLGEGGFGEVYRGTLPNGQEIAVKKLSRSSGQGVEEFKNEVVLVAKLQHRNLVRLLGFCLEAQEKILVYEFVPNKSLDYFLFDPEKIGLLDWSIRYKIIGGISRGILYLHEDSRLRIIHRDLKASNILLDADMNAKISDFGMARIVGIDQTQGNTSKIVGTYGYMSPEYAMHGQFSVKSDIYSFGVLLLEIIGGKKNSAFYQSDVGEDLISYAWNLWHNETPLEFMDTSLKDSYSRNEVIRCIHIGLLCVQEDPTERPSMASIVVMLNSYSATLALPQKPASFFRSKTYSGMSSSEMNYDQTTSQAMQWSVNEVSITDLYPR